MHRSLLRPWKRAASSITPGQIQAFLNASNWKRMLASQSMRQSRDLFDSGYQAKTQAAPMPPAISKQPVTSFHTFILGRNCARLLDAALTWKRTHRSVIPQKHSGPFCSFSRQSGVLVGEAVALCVGTLIIKSTISIRSAIPCRARVIPIGPAVHNCFANYFGTDATAA